MNERVRREELTMRKWLYVYEVFTTLYNINFMVIWTVLIKNLQASAMIRDPGLNRVKSTAWKRVDCF